MVLCQRPPLQLCMTRQGEGWCDLLNVDELVAQFYAKNPNDNEKKYREPIACEGDGGTQIVDFPFDLNELLFKEIRDIYFRQKTQLL